MLLFGHFTGSCERSLQASSLCPPYLLYYLLSVLVAPYIFFQCHALGILTRQDRFRHFLHWCVDSIIIQLQVGAFCSFSWPVSVILILVLDSFSYLVFEDILVLAGCTVFDRSLIPDRWLRDQRDLFTFALFLKLVQYHLDLDQLDVIRDVFICLDLER